MAEEGKKFSDLTKIEAFEVAKAFVYLMREAKTETGYEDVIILGSKFVDSLALPEGDMLKSVYDPNDDGKVNSAQSADFATTAGSVDWVSITSVPVSFPPSAHTHTASNVTDFAEAVAALLIAGDNVTIDVDEDGITINSTGGGGGGSGTVTSVKLATASSALDITGTNPVTTSGTINIGLKNGSDLQQLEALSAYGFAYRSSEGWSVDDEIPWAALANVPDFADVATSGDYDDLINTPELAAVALSGDYDDLENTPDLATVATTGAYSDLTGTPSLATVATSGKYSDLSDTPSLSKVATTGAYADLSGLPTLGTAAAKADTDFAAASHTHSASAITDFGSAVYALLEEGSNITIAEDDGKIVISSSGGGGGGGGSKTLFDSVSWIGGMPPAANFATLSTFEYVSGVLQGVHEFVDSVAQTVYFLGKIKQGRDLSSGAKIQLLNSCQATSGAYVFDVKLARANPNGAASAWSSDKSVTVTAQDTNTKTTLSSVTFGSGDLPSGLAAGDWCWVAVTRDTADGADNATGVARLIALDGEGVA